VVSHWPQSFVSPWRRVEAGVLPHASRQEFQSRAQASEQSAPGVRTVALRTGAWASPGDADADADAARFGGGAKAFVGTGATTVGARLRGRASRASSLGNVGPSDSWLTRVAANSTRSRDCPYVYPWSHARQQSFLASAGAALSSRA
jgi:hypothetical protein